MVNEPSYIEALAAIIEDQNKQIRTLKRRITKLSNKVESIEMLNFQQQITKLDKDLMAVAQGVLAAQQHVAWVDVTTLTSAFVVWLVEASRTRPTFDIVNPREYAWLQAGVASQQILASLDPISVSRQFRITLAEYCKQRHIPYFIGQA